MLHPTTRRSTSLPGNTPVKSPPARRASGPKAPGYGYFRTSSRLNLSTGAATTTPYVRTPTITRDARGGSTIGLRTASPAFTSPKAGRAKGSVSTPLARRPMDRSIEKSPSVPKEKTGVVKPRRRYVVGAMSHCGSIYEELVRQLVATGRWLAIPIKQRASTKALFTADTQQDISDVNIHLFLGEKIPSERLIASRRALHNRIVHGTARTTGRYVVGPRVPMGCGDDGELRVVDFIENTRCITLKSTMVTTLLRHHHYDWNALGSYLPLTFKISPRKPLEDERGRLLEMTRMMKTERPKLWIAKSSSGSHGDDIEIFSGDRDGLQRMLTYIDRHPRGCGWVAQQYLDRPLLYHRRKFDVRCFVLYIRETNSIYVHDELVMRLSSVAYDRDSAVANTKDGRLAHITNHCVQETGKMYSAFEEGNELWKEHLDGLVRYKAERLPAERRRELLPLTAGQRSPSPQPSTGSALSTGRSGNTKLSPYTYALAGEDAPSSTPRASQITLQNAIMPQIHRIAVETVLAAAPHLPVEPSPLPTHCFQILGYDFLIDESLRVWLLEINGAPGGPTRMVPKIMDDTIDLAILPFFPATRDARPRSDNGYVQVHPRQTDSAR